MPEVPKPAVRGRKPAAAKAAEEVKQEKKRDAKKAQKGKAAALKFEVIQDEEPVNIEKLIDQQDFGGFASQPQQPQQ